MQGINKKMVKQQLVKAEVFISPGLEKGREGAVLEPVGAAGMGESLSAALGRNEAALTLLPGGREYEGVVF